MSQKPAFPVRMENQPSRYSDPGMSLRDYFAAKALQGILAAYAGENQWPSVQTLARQAYEFGDAMMKAREERP